MTETQISELLIATGNQGKLKEIKFALIDLPMKLRFLEEFPNISKPDEGGQSCAENAVIKAQAYADQTGVSALADDSGLEVSALGGAPGVMSARFGREGISDAERTNLLLAQLLDVESEKRLAQFVCVAAIANPGHGVINIGTGVCRGRIAESPAGNMGFGFDPVFIPEGFEVTFAQMPLLLKNRISHRAKALAAIRQFLTQVHLET